MPKPEENAQDDHRAFIPNVHFELIPIRNLVSNQEYQRNLSIQHVKKAAEHFDIYQINPVKVSRRDGVRKTNNLLQWEQLYKAKKNNRQNDCNRNVIYDRSSTEMIVGAAILILS